MIHARKDYNHIQDPSGKIAKDEPVFILRAKDELAPMCLALWAAELIARGGDKKMANMVAAHAVKMINWQEKNGCRLPDLPGYYEEINSAISPVIENNVLRNLEHIIENEDMLALITTSTKTGNDAHLFIRGDVYSLVQMLTGFMNDYPDFKDVIERALNASDDDD